MLAMPGMRGYSLTEERGCGVSFGAHGVCVGDVALLQSSPFDAGERWTVRPTEDLNRDLSALYRLPVDVIAKANALALVAKELNRGDLALAAIATVQMQFPDPPTLAKGAETHDEILRRAADLQRSGLLKYGDWDPEKHPRAGTPPNAGWFAPTDGVDQAESSPRTQHAMAPEGEGKRPGDTSDLPTGGGGGGGGGRLFGPGGVFGPPAEYDGGPDVIRPPLNEPVAVPSEAKPVAPRESPQPWRPADPSSKLPFMEESEPQLAPYVASGKTSGIFKAGTSTTELLSGKAGPAANMPPGSLGFDGVTRTHVEGHAAALMWQKGLTDGTLYINNPEICDSCMALIPRMLPPGATMRVVLPDGKIREFTGISR